MNALELDSTTVYECSSDSDEIFSGYNQTTSETDRSTIRIINENGISNNLLNHPLTKLAEKLFNEQRVLDYHRIVFDLAYRADLLSE